jgi:pyrimidine-nucleoside phosphorylase
MLLGAGRATKESEIDLAVGLVLRKKIGETVVKGESLVTIYSNFEDVSKVKEKLYESIAISKEKVEKPTLIYKEIME